jgi:SAM-dependent methyltransferase
MTNAAPASSAVTAVTAVSATGPWQLGDAYERYMGRWSRRLAPQFLAWFGAPPGQRWLDVGCGTGALSAAVWDTSAPRSVIGVDPSAGFLDVAAQALGARVRLQRADAAQLPLPDASVDVVVAALVLNFVGDPAAALREFRRVAVAGGRIGACVWDYAGGMHMIRHYWEAAAEAAPRSVVSTQAERFPLCEERALVTLMRGAGLEEVDFAALPLSMRFTDFDDYWQPFLGGQGPAPAHAMSLSDGERDRVRECLRRRLPVAADGSITLPACALAVRGRVPA